MSGIVHNFFEFLQTIDDRFDFDDVDMSMLKDQNNCFTPIQLKSSDPEAAYRLHLHVHFIYENKFLLFCYRIFHFLDAWLV